MSEFDSFISSLSDEQKQKFVQIFTKKLEESDKTEDPKQESVTVGENFIVQKTDKNIRRREPVKARKNEWVDDGDFRDVETPKHERTPRNRSPHKKVDVECSVCGRSFKTDPKYVYGEYHRCSRCTGR